MSIIETTVSGSAARRAASQLSACPVCGGTELDDFFHLDRLPVHVGVLHDSQQSARLAPVGSITLTYCGGCSLVFNRRFDPDKLVFTPGYEVQLVHSALFRAFLEEVAERLIARYELRNKDIIDIGCGAGHFLRLLCERGGNRGIGLDPTLVQEGDVPLPSGQMRLVRGLFGQADLPLQCDFASCQSVLEDIPDPVPFIGNIRRAVEARRGHVYLEVFSAWRAFEAGETWSLCYEQCNYYSLASFTEAIRRAGFEILQAGGCYGADQYIYVEARTLSSREPGAESGEPTSRRPTRSDRTAGRPPVIERFAVLHAEKLDTWRRRIERFRNRAERVVVWGSGGKGICFLNTVGAADVFPLVVDINPDRQGRHVPGSGQPIVAPERLNTYRPDVVVLTNPLYETEIRTTVAEMGLECEFRTI